jgi:hypothetical protein
LIENFWSLVKDRVGKRCPYGLDELEKMVVEEFYAVPNETVVKLCSPGCNNG